MSLQSKITRMLKRTPTDDNGYNGGTKLGTFTSNNITTTVGQSSGPGGGSGNGGPGNGGFGPGWWN